MSINEKAFAHALNVSGLYKTLNTVADVDIIRKLFSEYEAAKASEQPVLFPVKFSDIPEWLVEVVVEQTLRHIGPDMGRESIVRLAIDQFESSLRNAGHLKRESLDRQPIVELFNEVDCRVAHGAESNGHLEYVRKALKAILYESEGESS